MFKQNLAQMKTRCLNTLVAVGRNGFDTISMSVIKSLLLTFSVALLFVSSSQAQEGKNWTFGHQAGLIFNPSPTALSGNIAIDTHEGSASISDKNGDLLFYTDGMTVWDKNHAVMTGGTGLMGNKSATQSAIIVPWPGSQCKKYFIFTVDAVENYLQNGLRYSVVDFTSNSLGVVLALGKNTLLKYPVTEKLTAISDGSGGFWVIAHGFNLTNSSAGNNEFYAYHITNAGVPMVPVTSNSGSNHGGPELKTSIGQLKVSPNGKRLAYASWYGNFVEAFNFNTTTGAVTAPQTIPVQFANHHPYGVEFSPDGSKLYLASTYSDPDPNHPNQLIQYNFATEQVALLDFSNREADGYSFGALQLGPDGKIYMAQNKLNHLSVINAPNLAWPACSYTPNGPLLPWGSTSSCGLPAVIQGQFSCSGCSLPSPTITGPATNCILTTTYSVPVNTGCSYSWAISNGTINGSSTGNSVNVTWNKAGTGSITVTITCNGCTTTKTIRVTPCIS